MSSKKNPRDADHPRDPGHQRDPDHPSESDHRGGFGEFGGETRAFIERTFREKIVLAGVTLPPQKPEETEASLRELASLVHTAGADVIAQVTQRRAAPDAATFIGRGKVDEILELAERHDADTVVFDDELSPAQQAKLEKILGRSAIDRTTVILDIFAQNAASMEGKAQVELAQLRYLLPRLRGMGHRLSQQAGGIGTRGPGETKLEVDRRRLERRIHQLERQLDNIAQHRSTQAKQRRRSALWKVALVGYTNAGKSTLLNALCGSEVKVRNLLFATLDATTRKLVLPGGEQLLLADTVGFINKLPHTLVEAFTSTLSVVTDADLLLHVVDASAADPHGQISAVREVLLQIGAHNKPELLVWNKCDKGAAGQGSPELNGAAGATGAAGAVRISAAQRQGLDGLLDALAGRLWSLAPVRELFVPHDRGDVIAAVHRSGQVLVEEADESGMRYRVRLDAASASRFGSYVVSDSVVPDAGADIAG